MDEVLANKIFHAIEKIQQNPTPEAFVEYLLRDSLNWPFHQENWGEIILLDDLGYDWDEDLEQWGLRSEDGISNLFQIANFGWKDIGIFLITFGTNKIFTKSRGMTTPLRSLLRKLSETTRTNSEHNRWKHLLFICQNEFQHFEFVTFQGKPGREIQRMRHFGWGPQEPLGMRTLCSENLPFLRYVAGTDEEVLQRFNRAFDVEKVSRSFYKDFLHEFSIFKARAAKAIGHENDDKFHIQIQLMFNRLLFLRFLEKKKWLSLGEGHDYLANLFELSQTNGTNFLKEHLFPLLFEGLTVQGKQSAPAYGTAPFLGNISLFRRNELDKHFQTLTNDLFEPLLTRRGLLYRYNFTVQESTPFDIEVAVDPEMIGTIFEELVTNRGGKGAFYTPRHVVSFMCREGLKTILKDKTDVEFEKIRALIDHGINESITVPDATKLRSELQNIRVIDPACGSGAYLLGMLQEVVKIHQNLNTLQESNDISAYEFKKRIISRSIYGVDIDPYATQIAMLRLWLSLAVEAEEPHLLPNLDFQIETGDGLLAPNPTVGTSFDATGGIALALELEQQKERYLNHSGRDVLHLYKTIRQKEGNIEALLSKNKHPGAVDYRVKFASIMANGGFDLVMANPPYVRQEELPKEIKAALQSEYATDSRYSPIVPTSDLYCYFYLRAYQLLRRGGLQIFICSNSWLDVSFGVNLQYYFLTRAHIRTLIDSRKERQFASAEVNTIISIIQKSPPAETEFLMLDGEFEHSIYDPNLKTSRIYQQVELVKAGEDHRNEYTGQRLSLYHRAPQLYLDMMDHLDQHAQPLKHFAKVQRGPVSGKNEFFFVETEAPQMEGIEDEFLYDILRRPQECPQILTSTSSRSVRLFTTTKDKFALKNTKALDYITEGEGMNYHKGSSTKNRKPWYKVRLLDPAPLLWMEIMGKSHRVFLNDANVRHSDKFYGIYVNDPSLDPVKLNIWLNSTPIILHKLLTSFNSLGAGALKTPVYEVENIPVPDLSTIEFDEEAYAEFTNREIKSVDEEMTMEDRITLEAPFMHLLGIDEETQAAMRDHVITMIQDRTDKAESV